MKIILAYDGSEGANRAAEAVRLFAAGPLSVRIVRVRSQPPRGLARLLSGEEEPQPGQELPSVDGITTQIRQIRPEAEIDTCEADGHPGEVIVREARQMEADLILMGRRGLGGMKQLFLGSVSLNVIHHLPCAVLAVQNPVTSPPKVLCAADGSDSSLAALRWVSRRHRLVAGTKFFLKTIQEQGAYFGGSRSVMTRDLDPIFADYYRNVAKQSRMLLEQAYDADTIESGLYDGTHPVPVYLLECADRIEPDLFLMGYRGLGAVSRLFTGSVTHAILMGSAWNVLIVPGPPVD